MTGPRRRIGLLGGSFNPAHGGHRRISLYLLRALALDEVWWLVSPGNPLKPKTGMVEDFGTRAAMPERVEVENVAFEGFMVRRTVVEEIGLPDPSYFIFYDDVDFAIRARRSGRRIWAVRDAVLVRQLDFDQQHDLAGWKGFYMYRNLFAVHLRYGENAAVRLKPLLIVLAVLLLAPLRGGRAEAGNVIRAMRAAWGMRSRPPSSVD